MAIRRFAIPGKLINSSSGSINPGPTGDTSVDSDTDGGVFQTLSLLGMNTPTLYLTFHAWFYPLELPIANAFFAAVVGGEDGYDAFTVGFTSDRRLAVFAESTGNTSGTSDTLFQYNSQTNLFTVNAWNSILVSVDLTQTTLDAGVTAYVNDVQCTTAGSLWPGIGSLPPAGTDFEFNQDDAVFGIMNAPGMTELDAYISRIWLMLGTAIDFDVTANRRKFIDASKRPVSLGATGERPTGTAPLIYLEGPAASYATNLGSGGDFRYINGATEDQNGFLNAPSHPATGTLA